MSPGNISNKETTYDITPSPNTWWLSKNIKPETIIKNKQQNPPHYGEVNFQAWDQSKLF